MNSGDNTKQLSTTGKRFPGPEDFTPQAVAKAVFTDTLQHPLTVYPLVLSCLALGYSVLFTPSPEALLAVIGGAFAGTSSWVFNYFIRGEVLAKRYIKKLRELRSSTELSQAGEIVTVCQASGFLGGAKEARELVQAYEEFSAQLKMQGESVQNLTLERFLVLAEDTYREGLQILNRALKTYCALAKVNYTELQSEISAWQAELAQSPGAAICRLSHAERSALEQRIRAHERLLGVYREQKDEVELLLAQSNELEQALRTASLSLSAVAADPGSAAVFDGGAGSRLESAVEAARTVEERLRHSAGKADDSIYLQALPPAEPESRS